jgi:hypothetical protein
MGGGRRMTDTFGEEGGPIAGTAVTLWNWRWKKEGWKKGGGLAWVKYV